MSVELPCRLGPYLLLRHLASGGMGAVYLAFEERDGAPRLCVVKTVRDDYASDRVAARRFVDEARTSALLMHKNVVAVYDVGEADGTAYIAVEYVAGRDLMGIFLAARQRGPSNQGHRIPVAVTLHVIAELLDALDHVHHATDPRTGEPLHVVHRDVSPQNVLVGFDGSVKLIDFGIARCAVREELTRVGQLVGKLRYVSPEQARGEPVDGATDVWATCVTACELLTGNRFWGERRAEAVAPLLAGGEPIEPAGFELLDDDVRQALRPGLHPDARVRPSAAALRDRLRKLADQRGLFDPQAQTRAVMEELFAGEEERERHARVALLHEPTVVRAAALPDSAVHDELEPEPGTDRATVGLRPVALPPLALPPFSAQDTRVLDPTPQSAPLPAAPSLSSRPRRPMKVRPQHWLGASAGALVVVAAAVWLATAPATESPPVAPDAATSKPASTANDLPASLPAAERGASDTAAAESESARPAALANEAPATAEAAPASAPRAPRKATRPRKVEARPRLFGDRVRALRECAPRPSCAASILRRAEDVTALSVDELRALDASLERCLQRCR